MYKNTVDSFGSVERLFHWGIFLLVAGMLIAGATLNLLPRGDFKSFVIMMHKSTGFTILVLMAIRLWWRIINPMPKALGPNEFENQLGRLMHIFLYILLFLQPIWGILMSQAFGSPVTIFGLFTLPTILGKNPAVGRVFSEMHTVTAILLTIAVLIHAGAGLKHHFINRDRTLLRMMFGK